MAHTRKHKYDDEEIEWRAWLKQNASLVEASGLPEIILRNLDHWVDFLYHGCLDDYDDPIGFGLDDLSIRQKAALLRLLLTWPKYLNTIVGNGLIGAMIVAVEERYKE